MGPSRIIGTRSPRRPLRSPPDDGPERPRFGLLNLELADGVIAFYDAKYTYNFWRPVTAIRAADTDDNPETLVDPTWLPEVGNTTPDPSYPGAHAVISAAAATVLIAFF